LPGEADAKAGRDDAHVRAMTVVPGQKGTAGIEEVPDPRMQDGALLVRGMTVGARWSLTSMSLPSKCSRLWMRSSMYLAFVEPRDRLQDLVRRYGLNATLDREHFYPSLDHVLDAINNAAEDSPMPPDEGMPPP
jgi:hypothetical protein